ncbi:MAG: alkaline phosphatase family protein, partial [Planctomycetota bacterium]
MTSASQSNQDSPGPSSDTRQGGSAARRVLIIGLDGATFDVLDPMMAEGRMPRLKQVIESGASGVLRSTIPPITPAAWTTFLTGKQPGTHGIIDFERYDVRTNRLSFNSTR